MVVSQYKKHYHPTNASKGSKDTSSDRIRENRSGRIFRMARDREEGRLGIKRMEVLSQVIC